MFVNDCLREELREVLERDLLLARMWSRVYRPRGSLIVRNGRRESESLSERLC